MASFSTSELPLWLTLFNGLGAAALIAFAYSVVLRLEAVDSRGLVATALHALMFSSLAMLTMANPLVLNGGLVIDGRAILVALSGPFGGFTSLIATTLATSSMHFVTDGGDAMVGVAGILIAAALSAIFTVIWRQTSTGHVYLLAGLSVTSSILFLSRVFLFPADEAQSVFREVATPFVLSNTASVFVVGMFLLRISELHRMAEKLKSLSAKDPLTGLLNRRGLMAQADKAEQGFLQEGESFTVFTVDIDYFKRINDLCGHETGDAVLAGIARILESVVGTAGTVARVGGEEFLVLASIGDHEQATNLADRLNGEIAQRQFDGGGLPVETTVSIGMATISNSHPSFAGTWAQADKALYRAKADGRNRSVWASRETDERSDKIIAYIREARKDRLAS